MSCLASPTVQEAGQPIGPAFLSGSDQQELVWGIHPCKGLLIPLGPAEAKQLRLELASNMAAQISCLFIYTFLSMQVATAIRGAIIQAKMTCIPVRRGYWGNKIGKPHTVPTKVTGKCGSVTVRLIPAPRGAGIVAARVPKKVLQMAGIDDCYTASRGSTKTLGNFVKVCVHSVLLPVCLQLSI